MGCSSEKEIIVNEMEKLLKERKKIQDEKENKIKELENVTNEKVVRKNVPDYLANDSNEKNKETNFVSENNESDEKKKKKSKKNDETKINSNKKKRKKKKYFKSDESESESEDESEYEKKKKKKKKKSNENMTDTQNTNCLIYNNNKNKKFLVDTNEIKSINISVSNDYFINGNKTVNSVKRKTSSKNTIMKNKYNQTINESKNYMTIKGKKIINMKEYLAFPFDETDFDDVIDNDKRKFGTYFCEKFKINQIFINTFYIKDVFQPRSLKILVLIMNIELYFVINAFFYNEDYLSDLFFSTEEEQMFSFVGRRFNEFIYTSTVSVVISYFVSYVFINEEKVKKIFRKNKEGDIKLKYKLSIIVEDMKKKFNIIIIFSLGLTIICFVYISCFNNVYPYIKTEWIKSSIFILLLMQIINLICTLLECILRYSAIKCNSEKIFRLSQVFAL